MLGNIFVERLWRSAKHEEVYRRNYTDKAKAWQGLNRYVAFFSKEWGEPPPSDPVDI